MNTCAGVAYVYRLGLLLVQGIDMADKTTNGHTVVLHGQLKEQAAKKEKEWRELQEQQ